MSTPLSLEGVDRPMVFTNGVFDLLHRGHVTYLQQARRLGASLVVGINSDASVRLLGKGPDRPFVRDVDRAFLVQALKSVTKTIIFDERTPCDLIARLRPDIYVKGRDYDMTQLEETWLVESWGGRAVGIDLVDGFSSTALASLIRR